MSKCDYRRELKKLAARYGLAVELTSGSHIRLVRQDGAPGCVVAPFSAGNHWRTLRNKKAEIRRRWPDLKEIVR